MRKVDHFRLAILTLSGPAFSVFRQAQGGGGGGLRGLDAKSQGYHQPIEMKLCMSQNSYESMPDAKFESGSFSSVEDMTSQRGKCHKIGIFTPGNGFNF